MKIQISNEDMTVNEFCGVVSLDVTGDELCFLENIALKNGCYILIVPEED